MEQQLNSSTGGWIGDDRRDEADFLPDASIEQNTMLPAVLPLTLKKKWFDMIKAGVKLEEYREIKRFWIVRLLSNIEYLITEEDVMAIGARFKTFDVVEFTNSYSKNSPRVKIECKGIEIKEGKKEWGAVQGQKYFTIKLGAVLA